jgi:hypothetical protein
MSALICRYCGTINTDPGGDPQKCCCGHCGLPHHLQRMFTPQEKALAGAAAGAGIGVLVGGGVPGALLGGLIGLLAPSIFDRACVERVMNQGIAIVASIFVIGILYFVCAGGFNGSTQHHLEVYLQGSTAKTLSERCIDRLS